MRALFAKLKGPWLFVRYIEEFAENHVRKNEGQLYLRKKHFLLPLGYGYMGNNLARLEEYPAHGDLADISNIFYFYFVIYDQGGWRAYRDLAFRSEMEWTKINVNPLACLARQKLCECVSTNFN